MAYSAEKEQLVKDSWSDMKQDAPELGFKFFSKVLQIAPVAKGMFSFLRDSDLPLEQNPRLRSHAFKVFKMTCESAVQLREKGEVTVNETTLHYLGSVHVKNGVIDAHFDIVKEALLQTIEEAVPNIWSGAMKEAWEEAYDKLAGAIIVEMENERRNASVS